MPVLIEEQPKLKSDDTVCNNVKLKLITEKIMEKSRDILMFFQVLYTSENDELFELMEELETNNPDSIMPFFRGQKDYILKINKKWILPSDNTLDIQKTYKLNIVFRKFNVNGKKGYYIRGLPEQTVKDSE